MPSGLWLPRRYLKPRFTVYWYSRRLNRIINPSATEEMPIPAQLVAEGYEKVVCHSAHDVEIWSQKLRDQEQRDKEIEDAKREAIEGPMRDAIRADLVYKRDHARNAFNREAMTRAIQNHDEADARRRSEKRSSFQHCEGFEEGH